MHGAEVLFYLLLDLVIIILAARGLGVLARKIGQPAVVGEVLAGIVLGPSVLGRFSHDAPGLLFPKEVPLKEIADLGLVFFMFLVGLELDTDLMKKEGRRALQISLSGIVAPFVLGMLLALALAPVNNAGVFLEGTAHPPKTFAFALFLGSAMCITAFPILARIMVETGLYKTPVGLAALCAASVDNAIAWILLAGVIGVTRSGSMAQAVPALLLTLVFVAFTFTAGRWLLGLLARRYDAQGRLSVDQVALILAGVLLSALTTEKIGIHAIFGAFLFGTVMPKRSGMTHELTAKVEDFTVVVLLPVFFAVTGLRTNLFALNSLALVGWLLLIILVATAGKFIGTGLAARLTGSSTRDSIIVGALMNTRGLTELVILTIGLSLGVLSDRTFAMMVVMALVTTTMAAPIINRLVSRDDLVGDLVGPSEEASRPANRVLVALGNPMNAWALVDAAIRLIGTRRPAELLLVHLIPTARAPEARSGLLEVEDQVAAAVASMRHLVEQVQSAGVTARPISFLSDEVGPDLARVAADQGCETILLGWRRASLARHVVRALVLRTFALAPCDVVVFVDREGRGIVPDSERPVVVALAAPGNGRDAAALRLGTRLADNLVQSMRLVGFLQGPSGATVSAASETLAHEADALRLETGLWVVPVFAADDPQGVVAQESDRAVVAVIPVGDDWATAKNFGAPAEALAENAPCPCFIVRGAEWVGASTLRPKPKRVQATVEHHA